MPTATKTQRETTAEKRMIFETVPSTQILLLPLGDLELAVLAILRSGIRDAQFLRMHHVTNIWNFSLFSPLFWRAAISQIFFGSRSRSDSLQRVNLRAVDKFEWQIYEIETFQLWKFGMW